MNPYNECTGGVHWKTAVGAGSAVRVGTDRVGRVRAREISRVSQKKSAGKNDAAAPRQNFVTVFEAGGAADVRKLMDEAQSRQDDIEYQEALLLIRRAQLAELLWHLDLAGVPRTVISAGTGVRRARIYEMEKRPGGLEGIVERGRQLAKEMKVDWDG